VSDQPSIRESGDWPLPPLLGEPESPEIHEIHQGILSREKAEPREGLEPTPWWVWAISVTMIFSMGFYLGRYGGTFTPQAHVLEQGGTGGSTAPAPPPNGEMIFGAICITCHQAGGVGVPGKYPPLAGSEWIAKDGGIPARIVLNGLRGSIQVKGQSYEREMPALGGQLEDAEIAAVLTYVRGAFGNKSGPVTAETVAKLRAATAGQGFWSAEKLLEVAK
jgi:mono/diheme cytochrome c family protein